MTIINIDDIKLEVGRHEDPTEGLCLLEAAAFVAGEPHTDHPKCVSPVLGAYGRRLNDRLGDDGRQKLKPFITQMLGTGDDGLDDQRRYLAGDWAVRVATPRLLRAGNLVELAERLEALAPITDERTAAAARAEARKVRDLSWDARKKARATLKARIEEELRKRGIAAADAAAADVAVDVADAVAAADAADVAVDVAADVADAVAAADAADVAVDVAAAVAAAAAADVAAADAAAVAAAAAPDLSFGTKAYWAFRDSVYTQMRDRLRSSESPLGAAVRLNVEEGIALLGRMIDPVPAEASNGDDRG